MCYTERNDTPICSSQEQPDPRLRRRQYATYAAGIEGTLSQGVRAFGLRHANYIGQAKIHLQHILIAIAINIVRVVAWIWEIPRTTTRLSPFARLVATMT